MTSRVLAEIEPDDSSLAGFEFGMHLTAEGRRDYESIHLQMTLIDPTNTIKEVVPLTLLLDRVIVENSGEKTREYMGRDVYLLSFMCEFDRSVMTNDAGRVDMEVHMPYAVFGKEDTDIRLLFRPDVEHLTISRIGVHAVPSIKAHHLLRGIQSMCLIPQCTSVVPLKGVDVLCAVVWHARGCSKDMVRIELREVERVLSDRLDWAAYDMGDQEFVMVCYLPFMNTTKNLCMHLIVTGAQKIDKVATEWVLVHLPEKEGWKIVDTEDEIREKESRRVATLADEYIPKREVPAAAERAVVEDRPGRATRIGRYLRSWVW